MATDSTLHLPSNSTALKLLTSLYRNPSYTVKETTEIVSPWSFQHSDNQIPKLLLKDGEEITGEATISEFLGEANEKIDWTPESRAETHEWLSRSSKFATDPHEVYVCSPC